MPRELRFLTGRDDAPHRYRDYRGDLPSADESALARLLSALHPRSLERPRLASFGRRAHHGAMKGRVETGPRVQNEANLPVADSVVTCVQEKGYVSTSCGGRAAKQSQLASFGILRVKRGAGRAWNAPTSHLPPDFFGEWGSA